MSEQQRWVLMALLVVFHLTLLAGATNAIGLMCWLVDVGLFIIWQPFVRAEKRLNLTSLLLIVVMVAGGAWAFGWWLLILWVITLSALLGGRVMMIAHRPTRVFYLLAFAYLLLALLLWLVPRVVPDIALIGPSLDLQFAWLAPGIFVVMVLMPRPRAISLSSGGMVDYFYSIFIFLLISVLVLGSLAFMLLRQSMYIEAVFKTLVLLAGMLFLIAWAWDSRPGFSGLGVLFSRYLLSIGLPFESWLQSMMDSAQTESDPDRFLSKVFEHMLELSWISGGKWVTVGEAAGAPGHFGEPARYAQEFNHRPLVLTLFTPHKLSPSLVWHFNLLSQLTNEYYVAKRRARELQQMSYLRAVHETGARLTHDVKNLLQSLSNLCFVAQNAGKEDGVGLTQLLQRQLPQITQRLQQTLEKLQEPQTPSLDPYHSDRLVVAAELWWELLQQRYTNDELIFNTVIFEPSASVSSPLFDSVADNLLHNALIKRQSESGLLINVTLSADATSLRVCDTGCAVRAEIVQDLLRAPVVSENGLGIGLYQSAKQAVISGYELRLADNLDGQVCFELQKINQGD
ncbi:MAG: sensor histidine kinase [Betaproteobacteria bacterium]